MKQLFTLSVESIPADGIQIQTKWDAGVADNITRQDNVEFKIIAPLELNLAFSLMGEKVILDGTLKTQIATVCVGCLSDFTLPLDITLRYFLWPQSSVVFEAEKELQQDDMEVGYYQGGVIELEPIVREQIYLAVPQNPHCREDCAGLCPVCGTNLNIKHCACTGKSSTPDSPFTVLQQLKK